MSDAQFIALVMLACLVGSSLLLALADWVGSRRRQIDWDLHCDQALAIGVAR